MPSMAGASVVQLSDKERAEFDEWTGDDIQHADVNRLQRAYQYYQKEGFYETVAAISARLSELGSDAATDASAHGNMADSAEARSSILSFQEETKQRRQRGQLAASHNGVKGMQPPVRSSKESVTGSGAAPAGVKVTSKGQPAAGAPTRSADLLTPNDQQLGRDTLILQPSGAAPQTPAAAAVAAGLSPGALGLGSIHQQQRQQQEVAGQGHVMIQEVEARGSRRTQLLLEQNLLLSEVERHVAAETARCRGNDLFRCGSYADAVEEYTLAIGLHPEQVAAYTNRSVAYLKLKQWQYAVVDATSALDLGVAQGIAPDSDLVAKALLRRAEAYMGLGRHQKALKDYDQVLSIMPDEGRAQQGALKAQAALRDKHQQQQQQQHVESGTNLPTSMRRVVVQECDSSDDEQQQQQDQHQAQQEDLIDRNGTTLGDVVSSSSSSSSPAAAAVDELDPAAAAAAGEAANRSWSEEPAAAAGEDRPLAHGMPAGGSDAAAAAASSSGSGGSDTLQQAQDSHNLTASAAAAVGGGGCADASADTGATAAADADADTATAAAAASGADIAAVSPDRTPAAAVGCAETAAPDLNTAAAALAAAGDVTFGPPNNETHCLNNGTWGSSSDVSHNFSSSGSSSDCGSECASDSDQEDHTAAAAAAAASTPTFDGQLDQLRLAGNEAYKAGAYRDAFSLYSRGIAQCPDAVALYINRSMTHIKQQQYRAAHDDATTAVALDPSSHKAYHKRHQAKQGLGDFQGAIQDLEQCITLAPAAQRHVLRQDLQTLHTAAAAAADLAATAAAAATAAGYTDHGVVQIQEEVDDPAEKQQRLHDELTAHEVIIAKRAAKARQLAQQQRSAWQQQQDHKIQQQQQLAAAAARRAERAVERSARKEARSAAKQQRREARKQVAAAAAAEAMPASPVVEDQAAAAASSSVRLDTPSNTPVVPEPISYQQQQQQHTPPTAAAVSYTISAAVEQLKVQGNAALAAGQYDAAEAAYMEALQLDGDNVNVLLNLAALRLKQGDGSGALRCCDEVLAQQQQQEPVQQQQQLAQNQIMKAHLRRGLALEQLGDPNAALTELLAVFNQRQEAGLNIDTQLAADMNRISDTVQQHKQEAAAAAATMADEQQQQGGVGFTGMRASIPVVVDSDSDSVDTQEDSDQQQQQQQMGQIGLRQQDEDEQQQQGGSDVILVLPDSPRQSLQQQQQQEVEEDSAAGTAMWQHPPTTNAATAAAAAVAAAAAAAMERSADSLSSPTSALNRQPIAVVVEDSSSDTETETEHEANDTDNHTNTKFGIGSDLSTDVSSNAVEQVVQSAVDQPQQQQQQQRKRAREDGNTLDKQVVQDNETDEPALPDLQTPPVAAAAVVNGDHVDHADTRHHSAQAHQQQQQQSEGTTKLRRSHSSGNIDSCQPAAADMALQHMDNLLYATSTAASAAAEVGSSTSSKSDQGRIDQTVSKAGSSPIKQQQAAVTPISSSPQQQHKGDSDQQQEWEQQRYDELQKLDTELKTSAITSTVNKGIQAVKTALNQLQTTAEQQQEAGNAAVAKAQLHQALKHYNNALSAAPLDARSYGSRSQVYLKLRRWRLCEVDCNTVLLLLRRAAAAGEGSAGDEQLRQKCRYRRALAWKEMGKIREAIGEAKQLLVENPKDSALQRLMKELKQIYAKHLQQIAAQQQQPKEHDQEAGRQQEEQQQEEIQQQQQSKEEVPAAAAAAAEPVSQVCRHRIVIEETDGSESEDEHHHQEQQQQPEQESVVAAAAGPDAAPMQQQQQQSTPAAATSNGSPAAPTPTPAPAGVHNPAPAASVQKAVQHLAKHQQQQLAPPKTALEFTRTAKMLLSSSPPSAAATDQQQQQLGSYVLLLDPIKYRSVIKRDLSDKLLELLLTGLAAVVQQEPQFVAEALHQLSQVERFGIVMSMVARRKGVVDSLRRVQDGLAAAGVSVVGLQKLYQL